MPSAETGHEVRRTFHIRDSRHNHQVTQRPPAPPASTTTPPLYYFKPVDSSPKPTASINSVPSPHKENTYIIYPTTSTTSSPQTQQKYLKKEFHPVGSYDAPTTPKSIYREETRKSKYHSANLEHLPKVVVFPF